MFQKFPGICHFHWRVNNVYVYVSVTYILDLFTWKKQPSIISILWKQHRLCSSSSNDHENEVLSALGYENMASAYLCCLFVMLKVLWLIEHDATSNPVIISCFCRSVYSDLLIPVVWVFLREQIKDPCFFMFFFFVWCTIILDVCAAGLHLYFLPFRRTHPRRLHLQNNNAPQCQKPLLWSVKKFPCMAALFCVIRHIVPLQIWHDWGRVLGLVREKES